MACKKCKIKPVWKFTNQTQLCKNCFTDYVERKVFRTIRQFNLLPKNGEIMLKKSNSLNTAVLKYILEKKFQVKYGKANISSENLSEIAEKNFSSILKGKFQPDKTKSPLSFISDAELELYAKLKNIKGEQRKKNGKIQRLFERFMKKNPDLEINIVKAMNQLPEY